MIIAKCAEMAKATDFDWEMLYEFLLALMDKCLDLSKLAKKEYSLHRLQQINLWFQARNYLREKTDLRRRSLRMAATRLGDQVGLTYFQATPEDCQIMASELDRMSRGVYEFTDEDREVVGLAGDNKPDFLVATAPEDGNRMNLDVS